MSAPTICTCTLNLRDLLGNKPTNAELVCTPRKSFVENANMIMSAPKRATVDANGLITLALVETTSASQQVVFTLNYDTGTLATTIYSLGGNFGTIVFDPIMIPNQASLDLSTVLTIARG